MLIEVSASTLNSHHIIIIKQDNDNYQCSADQRSVHSVQNEEVKVQVKKQHTNPYPIGVSSEARVFETSIYSWVVRSGGAIIHSLLQARDVMLLLPISSIHQCVCEQLISCTAGLVSIKPCKAPFRLT